MFLKLTLSLIILLFSSTGYCADWTADPDCLWALTMDQTSGNILDSCGSSDGDMSGSVLAAPSRTEGKFFGGLNFTGGNHYIPFGDVTFMDGLSEFTFSLWLSQTEDYTYNERNIIHKVNTFLFRDSAAYHQLNIKTSGFPLGLDFHIALDNYPTDYYISEDGNWHMYTITYDGSTLKAFRDCVEINDEAMTGTISNGSNQLTIGRKDPVESGIDYVYTGKMDDVLFVGREITAPECTDLMTNGIDGTAGHYDTMFKGYNIKLNKVKINGS